MQQRTTLALPVKVLSSFPGQRLVAVCVAETLCVLREYNCVVFLAACFSLKLSRLLRSQNI